MSGDGDRGRVRRGLGRGGGQGGGALGRGGRGGLGGAPAALQQPVADVGAVGRGGERGVEGVVGLHLEAESAQIPYGLPGAALAVLFRLGEPVQARIAGDGIELFTGEEPFGQVRGHRGGGGGDEAVLGVDGEVEVVGQRQILISWVSGAPRWSEARRAAPGGR